MQRFWNLRDAKLGERDIWVNGLATPESHVPGVECSVCGRTWGGRRQLPFECPAKIQDELKILHAKGSVLPLEAFLFCTALWRGTLRQLGNDIVLQPGDNFQPY